MIELGLVDFNVYDLWCWIYDVYYLVDDVFYGGGLGMVMKVLVWGEVFDEICFSEMLLIVFMFVGVLFI